jgi:cytosine/adenosine deaminase-related metal-dependent hydrolase
VVGACPITEANLGDGILPAADLLAGGVRIGIGTDSNVQIDAAAELRMLEYSQRLAQRRRNVLATASQPDTTTQLLNSAYSASDCALGIGTSEISPNAAADFVTLGRASDQCDVQAASQRVASWVFADERCIDQVWVGGRQRVANGSHVDSESVSLSCARRVRRLRT